MTTESTITEPEFDELLSKLEVIRDASTVDVYVPSAAKTVKYKQLTVLQQSQIMEGIITEETKDDTFSYNRVVTNLVLNNTSDDLEVKSTDRDCILIQLRCSTVGNNIQVEGYSFDLSEKDYTLTDSDKNTVNNVHEYDDGSIAIRYCAPSLQLDAYINREMEEYLGDKEGEEIIIELFKIEMSKHIIEVGFGEDTIIPMQDLDLKQRLLVCEKLPMKHSRVLITFIESLRDISNKSLMLSGLSGEIIEIPTDATLFTV